MSSSCSYMSTQFEEYWRSLENSKLECLIVICQICVLSRCFHWLSFENVYLSLTFHSPQLLSNVQVDLSHLESHMFTTRQTTAPVSDLYGSIKYSWQFEHRLERVARVWLRRLASWVESTSARCFVLASEQQACAALCRDGLVQPLRFLVSLTCLFPKRQSLGAADQHTLLWNLWVFNSHKLSSAPFQTFYLRLLPGTVSLCVFPLVAIQQQAQEVAFQVHVITDSRLKVCQSWFVSLDVTTLDQIAAEETTG